MFRGLAALRAANASSPRPAPTMFGREVQLLKRQVISQEQSDSYQDAFSVADAQCHKARRAFTGFARHLAFHLNLRTATSSRLRSIQPHRFWRTAALRHGGIALLVSRVTCAPHRIPFRPPDIAACRRFVHLKRHHQF